MSKYKKQVYLIRHAQKNSQGLLTDAGKQNAINVGKKLLSFKNVVSSESSRTQETARLLTDKKPRVDVRAGFYMASPEKSNELNRIAKTKKIPFLKAVSILNNEEVFQGIKNQATDLNNLINQLLKDMPEGEKAIIVSHDLSISPAMEQRGVPLESIDFLNGYIIDEDGNISIFKS